MSIEVMKLAYLPPTGVPENACYAPPAQRKPLTDEEIKAVVSSIDPDEQYLPKALKQLARAIEAAHGIKE